ncbi:unnamed protein product [Citrullus colocynthis]|uniref:Uncharacterized protein n=1 Tax=Citrullus colocynthis TaxID=252529 RepID=A0ABP0YF45_9ROSI
MMQLQISFELKETLNSCPPKHFFILPLAPFRCCLWLFQFSQKTKRNPSLPSLSSSVSENSLGELAE